MKRCGNYAVSDVVYCFRYTQLILTDLVSSCLRVELNYVIRSRKLKSVKY